MERKTQSSHEDMMKLSQGSGVFVGGYLRNRSESGGLLCTNNDNKKVMGRCNHRRGISSKTISLGCFAPNVR